jgi:HAD superfamily hydrolase (TIGR01509 family)
MKDIEAILFDFGGTLDGDGVDWFVRLYRGVTARHGEVDAVAFDECAHLAAKQISLLADTPRLSMEGTVERLCEHIRKELAQRNGHGTGPWTVAEVVEEFMERARGCLARNREVIRQLRDRYKLGVISNNWGNTAGWCRQFELSGYLATMIDSTLVGAAKPDRRIFQAALDELQLPAEACVYVGDRYECDVQGARAAGMGAVWVTGADSPARDEANTPATRISSLPELLTIF